MEPGVFRVDVEFQSDSEGLLGTYREYIRVVPETLRVKLGLDQRKVDPGDVLKARMENIGTQEISYSPVYTLQRRVEKGWKQIHKRARFFAIKIVQLAGRAGSCQAVHIPADAPAGRYRIRKTFSAGNLTKKRSVIEEFQVTRG